eukprot:TRINITY_DN2438_c0_g1_i1.p1 TRINITY_DN2438_c0_g1~~TRINITY_DN2438_c0_g1_i1.p1  ORF type:complete len:365 (+),score=104.49 TRINITY_DN2438_c0_g1_i1:36-1097(+)
MISVVNIAITILIIATLAHAIVPVGRSTWVYDVVGGETAMWSDDIQSFNTNNSKHSLNLIFSYGGDMEYYPGSDQPFRTYFGANAAAVTKYKEVIGVTEVLGVVDGRMDGGQDWSPDLSKLNVSSVQEWADITAAMYCSYADVSGIVIDLEPFAPPYQANLLVFLERMGVNVLSKNFGCVNSDFPEGRYIATFLFAEAATKTVYSALGPNGFVVISGYDLSQEPAGVPTTPSQYGSSLSSAISTTMENAGTTGKFMIAIPAAASTHEFSQYIPSGGATVLGYPMYNKTGDSYMVEAMKSLSSSGVYSHPGFLGTNLWAFSSFMSYPPHTYNLYYPTNPFVQEGEMQYLQANLV